MRELTGGDKLYKPLLCISGTMGFCILLNLPREKIFTVLISSAMSSFIFEYMCMDYSTFTSALTASLVIGIYSEIAARIIKTPSTVILLPSTIPLLPGSFLYYSMNYFVEKNYKLFVSYLLETVYTCFGIALGIILTVTAVLTLRKIKSEIFTNRK